MRSVTDHSYDVLAADGRRRTPIIGIAALGLMISALNGFVWVAVTWAVCTLAGLGTRPAFMIGVWLVATYGTSIVVLGVRRADDDACGAAAEIPTASAAAYAPDAAPRPPHSTR